MNESNRLGQSPDAYRGLAMSDWSHEETADPLHADDRNFYKVEKWTLDGMHVDSLLYAGNNLDTARDIFAQAVKHLPRIQLTIRQWPSK